MNSKQPPRDVACDSESASRSLSGFAAHFLRHLLALVVGILSLSSFADDDSDIFDDNGWEYKKLPNNCAMLVKAKTLQDGYITSTGTYVVVSGNVTADTWSYELRDYDTVESLERFETNFEYRVQVPKTLGGLKVVSIGNEAFLNYNAADYGGMSDNLVIKLPDTVTNIGDRAFAFCTGIRDVRMPKTLKSIGREAFSGCWKLGVFTPPEGWSKEKDDDYVSDEDSVKHKEKGAYPIRIPYSVTIIGAQAFKDCREIIDIDLGAVRTIDSGAFTGCAKLGSYATDNGEIYYIEIPETVTSIGRNAFASCQSLVNVRLPRAVCDVNEWKKDSDNHPDAEKLGDDEQNVGMWFAFGNTVPVVNSVCFCGSVGNIVSNCFVGCTSLYRCQINNSITNIEQAAFSGCGALTLVTFPKYLRSFEDRVFEDCRGISVLTIPDEVTRVGNRAFAGCSQLTQIIMGNNVTSIGDEAFAGCEALTMFEVPSTVTSVGAGAFADCTGLVNMRLANSVESIGAGIFSGCEALEYMYFSNKITEIPDAAFYGCSSLKGFGGQSVLTIPSTVTSIGISAFQGCSALSTISIPDSVTSIGDAAFCDCSGLKKAVVIPESVTEIGNEAFAGCSNLSEITITQAVLDKDVGIVFDDTLNTLKTIHFSANVTDIPAYSFVNCTALAVIDMPDVLASIGDEAFSGCSGIKTVEMPDSVTEVGVKAFYNCSSLKTLKLSESLATIAKSVFEGCTSLKTVTLPDSVQKIESHAFAEMERARATNLEHVADVAADAFKDTGSSDPEVKPVLISGGWQYTTNGVGEIVIMDVTPEVTNTVYDGVLVIPSKIDGLKVVGIGEDAFFNRNHGFEGITTIEIPSTVKEIGARAFAYCKNVTTVVVGTGCESIGEEAFAGCWGLQSIKIPANVRTIGKNAFKDCDALSGLEIMKGVKTIESGAFSGCGQLTEVVIPDSVNEIGAGAFENSGVVTVTLPQSVCEMENGMEHVFGDTRSQIVDVTASAVVTKIADGCFEDCTSLASVYLPDSVTAIGVGAFSGCTSLNTMILPNSVKTIDAKAFAGCTGLAHITMPKGLEKYSDEIFSGCSALTDVTIPDSVKEVGARAFADCDGLVQVSVGGKVKSIGDEAFADCDNLQKAILSDGVETIGEGIFSNCPALKTVSLSNDIESVPESAFADCVALETVELPDDLKSIGDDAFAGCVALKKVDMPDSVTSVGDYAFSGCTGITELHISNGLDEIGASVFEGCTGLTVVTIPDNVMSIGSRAFAYSTSLFDVKNIDHVTSIAKDAFEGCPFQPETGMPVSGPLVVENGVIVGHDGFLLGSLAVGYDDGVNGIGDGAFTNCTLLTSVVIGDGIESVGVNAFSNSYQIASVTIADSVKSLGEGAFANCRGLKSVVIGDGVEVLGTNVFQNCFSLTDVRIGKGVKTIEGYAFRWCDSLKEVVVPSSVETIGAYAFAACLSLEKITLPSWCAGATIYIDSSYFYVQKSGPKVAGLATATWQEYLGVDDSVKIVFSDAGGGSIPAPINNNTAIGQKAKTLGGAVVRGGRVVGIVQVKIGKANRWGEVSVAATITGLDGKRLSARGGKVPVNSGAVVAELAVRGAPSATVVVDSTGVSGQWDGALIVGMTVGGKWTRSGAAVYAAFTSALPAGVVESLLPDGEPVLPTKAGKWSFNRAASVKIPRYATEPVVDTTSGKTNLSAMKLTYAPNTGAFRGTFKLYVVVNGKLKKQSVKVSGFVLDGVGYGAATLNKEEIGSIMVQ
ncbi:MAG: leucine-rich repeat domain-containing protein [Kiritimatiellae bacterium]|nr:leucine-rich repeat domain-containing protein [Kiritimatiellia bacterium]